VAAYAFVRVSTDQQERDHQYCGVLASANARSLGPLQEVHVFATVLRKVTERWQRDTAMQSRLTAWGVPQRRTDLMDTHVQRAEAVRQACIAAALQAYENAGVSGLCHEGRWAYAVDAIRRLPLRPLVQALLLAAEDEEGGGLPSSGVRAASQDSANTKVAYGTESIKKLGHMSNTRGTMGHPMSITLVGG
jgi:hypothetical protein